MHRLAVFAIAGGTMLGAACTNDYDAFLDQSSGGASPGSSTAAGATTAAEASSGVTTTTSSASSSASSSGQSSGGGDGGSGGSGGGSGGSGAGNNVGGGGAGGGDVVSCSGFQLTFDDPDLDNPNGWSAFELDATLEAGGGELQISLQDMEIAAGLVRRDLDDGELDGCAVETTVLALPAQSNNAEDGDATAAVIGVADGDDLLAVVYLGRFATGGSVKTEHGILSLDGNGDYVSTAGGEGPAMQPTGLRIRGLDQTTVAGEIEIDGEWIQVGDPIDLLGLEGDVDSLVVGAVHARLEASEENDSEVVIVGPINPDAP